MKLYATRSSRVYTIDVYDENGHAFIVRTINKTGASVGWHSPRTAEEWVMIQTKRWQKDVVFA